MLATIRVKRSHSVHTWVSLAEISFSVEALTTPLIQLLSVVRKSMVKSLSTRPLDLDGVLSARNRFPTTSSRCFRAIG